MTAVPPLHPDLKGHVSKWARGEALLHPLIQTFAYSPAINGMLNDAYEEKRRILREAEAAGDWSDVVFLHERPYRFSAFLEHEKRMDVISRWAVLGEVWVDSENIYQHKTHWNELIMQARHDPAAEHFMDEEECDFLKGCGDWVKAYRGFHYFQAGNAGEADNASGLSYSLDKDQARRFAEQKAEHGIIERVIDRADIFAYKNGRGEREIILYPDCVAAAAAK